MQGFPRNLGGPDVSSDDPGEGKPVNNPGLRRLRSTVRRERNNERAEVPPSQGETKAKRDGRSGVGATHSTAEAGEPTRRDPVEGTGSPQHGVRRREVLRRRRGLQFRLLRRKHEMRRASSPAPFV